jgi:hypothetical protein
MKRAARGAPHLYYPNVRFSVRIMRSADAHHPTYSALVIWHSAAII